jgi:GNAT superfamily N-acetyltransferase
MQIDNIRNGFKYEFKEVDIDYIFNSHEFHEMLVWHWSEVSSFKDYQARPDWDRYRQAYELDMFKIYVIELSGLIVGYATHFISFSMHYENLKSALADAIYISPEHRGLGKKFIAWIDEQLKNDNVIAVYRHATKKNRFSILLDRMGYEQIETTYLKRLDNG